MVEETRASPDELAGLSGSTNQGRPLDEFSKTVRQTTTELEVQYDDGVPYERVVQVVCRETGASRSAVERAVERLYSQGRLEKPNADRLRTCR